MNDIMTIKSIDCYEQYGTAYLQLEAVARGLGFAQTGNASVDWELVDAYLNEFGFSRKEQDRFVPENVFHRLAMKAPRTAAAEAFQAIVVDEVIPAVRRCNSARPIPSPFETVQAARLLLQSNGPERISVIRLLKQGGFDVDRLDSLPVSKSAPAVKEAPAVVEAPAVANARTGNDTGTEALVREFLEDILPRARWDLLPFMFLDDLYRGWLVAAYPGTRPCNRNQLIEILGRLVSDYGWTFPGRNGYGQYKKTWTANRMTGPEPMIIEFGLTGWYNPDYQGDDPDIIARPKLAPSYPGICRTTD